MVNIYIEGQLIDQYSDEAIEITSSVLDVGDLTKNTGDFSKTFTVPASQSNNKYFQHWYNASIDDGFDARTKVEGSIDIDGVPFKLGKWRLSEAIFKNGVIDGYVINFFGNLPNIKDTIGDDLLSDISFADFDHDWTGDNIKLGLKGQLFDVLPASREVVYTPMSNKRYFYDSDSTVGDSSSSVNISSTGDGAGIEWRDLRPSIKAKSIVDSIQHKYGTGTKQVIKIEVKQAPTLSGTISLTINGIQRSFGVSPASIIATASTINTFVGVLFGSYVTTSVLVNVITITSIVMEDEIAPLLQTKGTGALELKTYVDEVGAFPHENPIVFSNNFFQTSEFEQVYLWLNNGDLNDIGESTSVAPWTQGDLTDIDPLTDVITFNTYRTGSTASDDYNLYKWNVNSQDIGVYGNIPFTLIARWTRTDDDGTVSTGGISRSAVADENGNVPNVEMGAVFIPPISSLSSVFEMQFFIRTSSEFRVRLNLERTEWIKATGTGNSPIEQTSITTQSYTQDIKTPKVLVSSIMPNIKIVDFLKGIFDMFKLVIVPQDDGSMLVDTLDSFYSLGVRHDISDKVDYSTYKVKRGELYQSISYEFEDPSTILNEEFQKRARDGQSYGSSLVNVYESLRPRKLIDGEKVEIKVPFEQVVYDRLIDPSASAGQGVLNISTGTIADKDLRPVNPKAILHYVSEQDISDCNIKFNDNNNPYVLNDTMLMPMNQFGTLNPNFSLLFESEVSCWDGTILNNNLYTLHHSEYIEAVFRLKRRSFEYEALLPTSLITRLNLNDIISVKGIDYRINKFKYNLLTGITKLDLINGFDTSAPAFHIPSFVNMNKYSFTLYFNVPRADTDYTISVLDTGDGNTWLTSGRYGSTDNMMFIRTGSRNTSELSRTCNVVYTNTVTGEINVVIVKQLGDE